jgi:hypothetical protein
MTFDTQTQSGILAFRDGAPTEKEIRRLIAGDPKALEALIESRILALAVALPAAPAPGGAPLPAAEDLLAYLTAPLSDLQRAEWEARLRGDARAFAALLELRRMLKRIAASPPRPEDVPPSPPRIALDEIRWRVRGQDLVFPGEGPVAEAPGSGAMFALRSAATRRQRDAFEEPQEYADFTPESDDPLGGLLSQIAGLLSDVSRALVDAQKTGQGPDAKTLFMLSDRLRGLADEVGVSAKRRPRPRVAVLQDALPRVIPPPPPPDRTTATRAVPGVLATLVFAGVGGSSPAIEVSFKTEGDARRATVEATFVIPNRSFDCRPADLTGTWRFPLPSEPAFLLIHGLADRTLSIRLTPAR